MPFNNFCLTPDGALTGCPANHTRETTISPTAVPLLDQAVAESRTAGGTVVNTAYTNFDFHPTTLFMSGISTLLILALVALCYFGSKKMYAKGHRRRAPMHNPPCAHQNEAQDNW